jgi:hypothetical protein
LSEVWLLNFRRSTYSMFNYFNISMFCSHAFYFFPSLSL